MDIFLGRPTRIVGSLVTIISSKIIPQCRDDRSSGTTQGHVFFLENQGRLDKNEVGKRV